MGNISPRPGRSPSSRRKRESRAFTLVMVGGAAGAVAAVGLILAIFGVVGAGIPLLAAVIAVLCLLLFRTTVSK
jgi:hypothetical protein